MRIFGFHPVREALRHRPQEVVQVWSFRSRRDGRHQEVEALCRRHGLSLERGGAAELQDLAEEVHNGFLAEVRDGRTEAVGDVQLRVLLEDIQDPRNLGALLRVFDGAGVGEVLIRDRGSSPLSPAVVKTSAGAAESLQIRRITNSSQEIRALKEIGFWVYGADVEGQPVWEVDLRGPVLLCFGGEEKGLRHKTRQLCDGLVSLPMKGRVGSLNVATAAAAILFDAVRQRGSGAQQAP
jgi:23S rRNA (guanosine2251-2'-O)-methyltransferase